MDRGARTVGAAEVPRSFNRFELKYLIDASDAALLRSDMERHMRPDGHGGGRYRVESLYYDSPDLRCYWEKVEGIKFRRKLRIRRYASTSPLLPESPVFAEIKQRVDKVTQKRRVDLPYAEALALCSGAMPDGLPGRDIHFAEEIADFVARYRLEPACVVSYTRLALMGGEGDAGLRVTFDGGLSYRRADLDLASGGEGLPMLDPSIVVLEIKADDRIPYWIVDLAARRNLSLARISKYCLGMEAARAHLESRAAS